MSLPSIKPAQRSITSFFQSKPPKFAPPPSQANQQHPPTPSPPAAEDRLRQDSPSPLDPRSTELPPLPDGLHPKASIRRINTADVNPLRRINSLLFPVSYPDDFYRQASEPGAASRVITWADDGGESKVVGGIVCRVEPTHAGAASQTLYIRSMCILSPYRSLGLVGAALDNIVAGVVVDPERRVETVTAHVWTENDEGIRWYEARGFRRDMQQVNGYYRKLRPDSAWLVRRDAALPITKSASGEATSTPAGRTRAVQASPTAAVVNLPPMSGPPVQSRPPPASVNSGQSYQKKRPEVEWNDLPEDMATGMIAPPKRGGNEPGSAASSRSSSATKKKRDRSYPAAAFGSS